MPLRNFVRLAIAALILASVTLIASAQSGNDARRIRDENLKAAKASADQPAKAPEADPMRQWIEMNKPGEQHALLRRLVGEWDADVEMTMAPGAPVVKSKGKSGTTSVFDGRYLHSDFTGEMMGQPFRGAGLIGYDNVKKKYFSAWIDQMSTGLMVAEGSADKDGKVITLVGEQVDPTSNQKRKYRWVTTIVDDSKNTFEAYEPGPDGKGEIRTMVITYTRAK